MGALGPSQKEQRLRFVPGQAVFRRNLDGTFPRYAPPAVFTGLGARASNGESARLTSLDVGTLGLGRGDPRPGIRRRRLRWRRSRRGGLLALRRSQTEQLRPARLGLSARTERTGPRTGHKTRPVGVTRG